MAALGLDRRGKTMVNPPWAGQGAKSSAHSFRGFSTQGVTRPRSAGPRPSGPTTTEAFLQLPHPTVLRLTVGHTGKP